MWLRLLNRQARTLVECKAGKLAPQYAGPFQVKERIGKVAYWLGLPENARIHNVFHVGVLKPFHGTAPSSSPPLPPLENGRLLHTPEHVLHAAIRCGVWHVLVQWGGTANEDATWEPVQQFRDSYPSYQLEDELFEEGRGAMTGKTSGRRKRGERDALVTTTPEN